MKVLRVGGLAAETTTAQPVSILESVKCLPAARPWLPPLLSYPSVGAAPNWVLKFYFAHTRTHEHTHTHILAHKHTCRKVAEVCVHRKQNIR